MTQASLDKIAAELEGLYEALEAIAELDEEKCKSWFEVASKQTEIATRALSERAKVRQEDENSALTPRDATDYTVLESWELIRLLQDDAAKWAAAFRQIAVKLGYSDMDEGWLIGWFANAIEVSGDHRANKARAAASRGEAHPHSPPSPASLTEEE